MLRVHIDKDMCVSAGKCVADAPSAFGYDDDELGTVLPGAAELTEERLIRLARQCPGRAIILIDSDENTVSI